MSNKKRILLVEDELDYGKMVRMRLDAAGYDVTLATDAYHGAQEIIKKDFDLVILDLMMPMGGGESVLERMRAIPAKAHIPVVILTAKPLDDRLTEYARVHDVSVIFGKPYDAEEFLSTIASILSEAPAN